jgi:hypothetical protein
VHWTYSKSETDSDLQQGDLLSPTENLREILKEVHPHFCAEKYLGFVITTQSCDLVRRGNKLPKAHYINIAAVRSLKDTAAHIFERVVRPVSNGVFRKSDRATAKDLLHRIFNQNEQTLGLFYFHPDADIGLGDHSVAFLRIVIALRVEHYEVLLKARTGGLGPAFQAKLGWLVGNLYSRAATPDWSDYNGGQSELEYLEAEYLKEQIPGHGPIWVDDELILAGQSNNIDFDDFDSASLLNELEQYRPLPSIEKLAGEVIEQAKNVLTVNLYTRKQIDEVFDSKAKPLFELYENQLKQSVEAVGDDAQKESENSTEVVKETIKQSLVELKEEMINLLSVSDDKLNKLSNRLRNNGKVKKLLK